jgi:hypothetical protein
MITTQIEMSAEEYAVIESRAHERGYATVSEQASHNFAVLLPLLPP